jgi:hypothetical protein
MPKRLLFPEDARDFLGRRFNNQHRAWLEGNGQWPLTLGLGSPIEQDVITDAATIRSWVDAWRAWDGVGTIVWEERKWARLGTQQLPATLTISTPLEVAAASGQKRRWTTAFGRHQELVDRWPTLAERAGLSRHFDMLADYPDADFGRLVSLLAWFQANPSSGHYLRQLPVEGLDTKWLEKRTGLVVDLLRLLRSAVETSDFHTVCGLRRPSQRVRVRLLCPKLRAELGGLSDIEAPLEELLALPVRPRRSLIVENLETGIALPTLEDTVAVMKLGNAVGVVAAMPWMRECRTLYWGDLDTHGLAILDQARQALPGLASVLMDEQTLLRHRSMWGQEPSQHPGGALPNLEPHERAVFEGLKSDRWGQRLRLEQERLPWNYAMETLREALERPPQAPATLDFSYNV